ncbi:AraC family transcriptional regulator [Membranihabitans maritimus]|uniref:AraC family transcriptional regulator n=1 Tax=Membranihabitans maritimus TaxID=2904244 RepID=UPI001F1ED58E|nr:AraC family transcriptional regulator [Membranihabitans maritimus]
MKPIYFRKYATQPDHSFLVKYAEVSHTYNQFHYHNEFELLYHIENKGTRFVGDSIQRFNNGDLVLVGSNIPHYWLSDEEYFQNPDLKAKVVLVQFAPDFLGNTFMHLPEMKLIDDLLIRATQGIQICGEEAKYIGQILKQLPKKEGWEKMLLMIEILCKMSQSRNYNLLASRGFCEASKLGNEEKISQIFNFIVKNHNKNIALEEVANVANMNPSAFCRYFKRSTSKTFSTVLNEIRIGFACKDLINTDKSISEIAYTVGYSHVSYFNRKFKKIKKVTPQEYREKFRRVVV